MSSTLVIFASLMGCSWLFENPEAIPRHAPRPAQSVLRTNEITPRSGIDPEARDGEAPEGVGQAVLPSERAARRYNPVVTPTVIDGEPVEFTNSSGTVIRTGTTHRKSDLRRALDGTTDPGVRRAIQDEIETAERAGFRQY